MKTSFPFSWTLTTRPFTPFDDNDADVFVYEREIASAPTRQPARRGAFWKFESAVGVSHTGSRVEGGSTIN